MIKCIDLQFDPSIPFDTVVYILMFSRVPALCGTLRKVPWCPRKTSHLFLPQYYSFSSRSYNLLPAIAKMPAPTALLRRPEELTEATSVPLSFSSKYLLLPKLLSSQAPSTDSLEAAQDEQTLVEAHNTPNLPSSTSISKAQTSPSTDTLVPMTIDSNSRPIFPPAKDIPTTIQIQSRKVSIPPHRMTPLKTSWPKIYPPLVEHLKLQVRMNVRVRAVELRTSKVTVDDGALQKGEDFVKAFSLGFDVDDAIALLRLDDLYIETFEIKDVKTLSGEHLGRAIGRIAGKDGKTRFAIEQASKTRVVLADSKVHILGGFQNIHIAREAIVSLILGSPPVSLRRMGIGDRKLTRVSGQSLWELKDGGVKNEGTILMSYLVIFVCIARSEKTIHYTDPTISTWSSTEGLDDVSIT